MAGQQASGSRGLPSEVRVAVRAMWALGDYNRFATELDPQSAATSSRPAESARASGCSTSPLEVATSRFRGAKRRVPRWSRRTPLSRT